MRKRPGDLGGPPHDPNMMDQNQPDYASQVTAALGVLGRVPAILDTRFQLGFTVDDLNRAEFAILRRRQLWQGRGQRTPTAANFNYVCLPGVPGTLVHVTKIILMNGNAATQISLIGLATANAVMTVGSTAPRDGRLIGQVPSSIPYTGTAVGPIQPGGKVVQTPPGQTTVLEVDYILAVNAGTVLTVVDGVVNQLIDVTFEWSERAILPSEVQ